MHILSVTIHVYAITYKTLLGKRGNFLEGTCNNNCVYHLHILASLLENAVRYTYYESEVHSTHINIVRFISAQPILLLQMGM